MVTIKIEINEDDVANAVAKLQGLLDKNGKWVFAWSQETKDMVLGSKKYNEESLAGSKKHYDDISDCGRSLFDYMTWTKTQGKPSPFVTFEDKLSCATYYASASYSGAITQNSQPLQETIEVWALRIDPLLQKAATSVIEYINNRSECIDKLYTVANRKFYNMIDNGDVVNDLIAFLSEQDKEGDKEGLLVDGVRPQWYMFSTGENSFAENLAASLNYDLTEMQNNAVCNYINVSGFENLPQIVSETIMAIKILVTFSRRIDLFYLQDLAVNLASNG